MTQGPTGNNQHSTVRIATTADLTQLMKLGMRTYYDTAVVMNPDEIAQTCHEVRKIYEAHLNSPLCRTWVAEVNHDVVATGSMRCFVRTAHPGRPPVLEAYISDMYTLPENRRQGFATAILDAAKLYAQSKGVKRIWLHATAAGHKLYSAEGFQNAAA